MRILQINTVCGITSTGKICTDLYNVLKQEGHDCLIAYGKANAPDGYNTYRICGKLNNHIDALQSRIFDNQGFNSTFATEKLIKKIKDYNPDVIHLHNLHGYYLNVKVLFNYLKKEFKGKIIWTLHDCWPFTGHCAYFDYVNCDSWQSKCNHCLNKNTYPKSIIFDNSKNNFQRKIKYITGVKNLTLVSPSQWLADLTRVSIIKDYPVKVINNGIDTSVFKPATSNFKKEKSLIGKKIILGVANVWERRKGLDDFVKLSRLLSDHFIIVLVGLDDEQLTGLPKNIYGIKRTNSIKELAEIYSVADVFLNPTYEDNYPTTNLEALACGTPIITYKTGGSIESVEEGYGYVVEKGDINSVTNIIKNIQIKENSKLDFSKFIEKFDKNNKFKEYLELYKE